MPDAPQPQPQNGAQSLGAILVKISDRLDGIEARMAAVESAAVTPKINLPAVISQCVAGALAVAVVVGAVMGKIDLSTALAFAGGLGFSLPGLLGKGGAK